MGQGVTEFNARLADQWIMDSRPTFDTASGGVARIKRRGPEWEMTFTTARAVVEVVDAEKRGKRLARLSRP